MYYREVQAEGQIPSISGNKGLKTCFLPVVEQVAARGAQLIGLQYAKAARAVIVASICFNFNGRARHSCKELTLLPGLPTVAPRRHPRTTR